MRLLSNVIKSGQVKSGQKFIINNRSDHKIIKDNIDNNLEEQIEEENYNLKQQILIDAQKKADEIVADAQAKAEKIINQSKEEAEKIKSNAEAEANEVIKTNKEKAYKQGIELGKEEGLKQIVEKFNSLTNTLHDSVEEFDQEINERMAVIREDIVKLSIAISRKIIGQELQLDSELIKNIIQDTIRLLDGEEEISIRVSPGDIELLGDYKEQLIALNNGLEKIKIISDESIKEGGCIIETDFGGFDASIDSQLKEIESRLLEVNNDE